MYKEKFGEPLSRNSFEKHSIGITENDRESIMNYDYFCNQRGDHSQLQVETFGV